LRDADKGKHCSAAKRKQGSCAHEQFLLMPRARRCSLTTKIVAGSGEMKIQFEPEQVFSGAPTSSASAA
jgi:hypothetical protein